MTDGDGLPIIVGEGALLYPRRDVALSAPTRNNLIARLWVNGASRELDADLWWALCERASESCFQHGATGLPRRMDHTKPMPEGMGRAGVRAMAPAFTASLDATLKLIGEKLPGALWRIGHAGDDKPGLFYATVMPEGRGFGECETSAAPVALLIALLRALSDEA